MAGSVSSAQYANHLMEEIIVKKGLEFNLDKCMYIVMGNKKTRKSLKSQLDNAPLTLCNTRIKEVNVLKYLGDHLSYNLEQSVHQTVMKRVAIAKHAVFEMRTVMEDTRSGIMESVNMAFMIWETAVMPSPCFYLTQIHGLE